MCQAVRVNCGNALFGSYCCGKKLSTRFGYFLRIVSNYEINPPCQCIAEGRRKIHSKQGLQAPKDVSIDELEAELREIWKLYDDGCNI